MKSKNLHVGRSPTGGFLEFLARWWPALAVGLGIFVASSLPARQLPDVRFAGLDKLEHALAYAVLAAACARALCAGQLRSNRQRNATWLLWLTAVVLAVAFGMTDELHQAFVPGRTPELADLLADAAGGATGAFAYLARVTRDEDGRTRTRTRTVETRIATRR